MTVAHVVFDIGKVLIHYDPHIPFRQIIPDDDRRAFFLGEVCSHEWNLEQDRGRPWPEAEAEAIARHPEWAEEIRAFRRDWRQMVPHAYEGSVAILRGLIADGVDVTLLTNFASDTFREAQEKFPFLTETRGVTVSGDIALIKPDRAIYDHHAARFDLDPVRTVFIDDSAPNVDGARQAGWQAIHFTDGELLCQELATLGLPVPSRSAPAG
ncbi:HAD family hydrolase [Aurantimonas marianensis]|uniref:HAD family phosphatase n=1 Tax=Aurantimonas marianensis TaxID=2920428 RepID=A0A9X2H9F5_9HYPH|nr:HAD family phosphatase [Aurantimonas marianensis]MCP3056248.1 HAD family phosphatase [Aurantimonas marianensis]